MNRALKAAALGVASTVPLPWWDAVSGVNWALPYYHLVSDEPVPHVASLYRFRTVREFGRDLDFFCRRYRPVTLPDFLRSVRVDGRPPAGSLLLTFDDGFREIYDVVAPMLRARGVPAVFFVNRASVDNRELIFHQKVSLLVGRLRGETATANTLAEIARTLRNAGVRGTDPVRALAEITHAQRGVLDELGEICGVDFQGYLSRHRPYLTGEQIRELRADGFSFGGHSVDHPCYGDLPLAEQLRQTAESVRFLRDGFGVQERVFAFPHSDAGVGEAFFASVFSDGTLEASFGTGGVAAGAWPGHFQRFSMEKAVGRSARRIISRHHASHHWRQLTGTAATTTAAW